MRVTIDFKIDEITLKYAITSLVMFGSLKMNKRNIIDTIKNQVYQNGKSIINSPEYWGEDLIQLYNNTRIEIDRYFERYKHLIE